MSSNYYRCFYTFPSAQGTASVRFNAQGTRLLCLERSQPPVIYDTPSAEDYSITVPSKTLLNAQNYSNTFHTLQSACFAGYNDELVATGSDDGHIYVWSVGNKQHEPLIQQPLLLLSGKQVARHVRYNSRICALASCSNESSIKFWTPFALPVTDHVHS